jgi:hypothetical protein
MFIFGIGTYDQHGYKLMPIPSMIAQGASGDLELGSKMSKPNFCCQKSPKQGGFLIHGSTPKPNQNRPLIETGFPTNRNWNPPLPAAIEGSPMIRTSVPAGNFWRNHGITSLGFKK